MRRLRAPRLLPMTIGMIAILLTVKSVTLARLALGGEALAATQSPYEDAAPIVRPQPKPAPSPVPKTAAVPSAPSPSAPSPSAPPASDVSESERALLLELRARRRELDDRAAAMAAREAVVVAAERRLTARVAELEGLQARLEGMEHARQDREEANWRGLVRTYEQMKPVQAAAIFNDLDPTILVSVLDRMAERKAAPVLAAMQPDRARQVTADLARLRTRANTPEAAP